MKTYRSLHGNKYSLAFQFWRIRVLRLGRSSIYFSLKFDLFWTKTRLIFYSTYVQIGHDWVSYVMASDLPKYMKEVLGFSVHEVGLYSSLPYLLMFVVSILSAFLCDSMINRNYLTITQTRKIFTAASMFLCWRSYTRVYPTSSEVMI